MAAPASENSKPTRFPEPGPAPVGPAVRAPEQIPIPVRRDPGAAPVGPAVEPQPKP